MNHELDFEGPGDSSRRERADDSYRDDRVRRLPPSGDNEPGSGSERLRLSDSPFVGGDEGSLSEPPSERGGESSRSPLRRTDSEENVYVLLDDQPEPPSRREPAPALDAHAPLVEVAPAAPDPDATAEDDDAPILDGLRPRAGEPDEGADADAGAPPAERARPLAIKDDEADEEEPEFLYPKRAEPLQLPDHLHRRAAAPRRPTALIAVGAALLLAVAGVVGGRALWRSRPAAPPPMAVDARPPKRPEPTPATVATARQDQIGEKLRRALAWGFPADAVERDAAQGGAR